MNLLIRPSLYSLLGLTLVLGGCEMFDKKKEILTGERHAVLLKSEEVKPRGNSKVSHLPAPQTIRAWPQAGGNPEHLMPAGTFQGVSADPIWVTSIGSGTSLHTKLLSGPVVSHGHVYALDTDLQVSSIDAKTGSLVWKTSIAQPDVSPSGLLGGGVAVENGKVFVTSPMAEVLCLDAKTGKILWRHTTSSPIRSAPTVKNGRLYVITVNNQLDVLSVDTGKHIWSHTGVMESAGVLGGASPAISQDGVVIVPYTSGEVYALRSENGHPLWSESLTSNRRSDSIAGLSHIRARPIVDGGTVYVVSYSGRMLALDLRTGHTKWAKDIGGIRTPFVAGDYLYMLTNESDLVCLNKHSGETIWSKPMQRTEDPADKHSNIFWAGPVMVNDQLVFSGSHGQALFINARDGKITRELPLPSETTLSPITAESTIFFLSDNGELAAYK